VVLCAPVTARLPSRAGTDLMVLAAIRLWVPTARLLRKIFTLAPPPMPRMVSTMDELPTSALPAATCCSERELAPALTKSTFRPSSAKNPFSSATIAGQIDTLMPMMAAVTVGGPSARAGAAIVNARLSAPARMGRRQVAKRDVAKSVAKSNAARIGRSPADDRACGAEATVRRLRRASPKSKFDAMRPLGAAVGQRPRGGA